MRSAKGWRIAFARRAALAHRQRAGLRMAEDRIPPTVARKLYWGSRWPSGGRVLP